jgi:hypothetical protein
VQFCACKKPTSAICRVMLFSFYRLEPVTRLWSSF